MTASPEWWKEATPRQQAEFFARSEQWLEKKYGKDRVVAAVVHRGRGHPALVSVRGAIDAGWTAVRERVYWRAVKDA